MGLSAKTKKTSSTRSAIYLKRLLREWRKSESPAFLSAVADMIEDALASVPEVSQNKNGRKESLDVGALYTMQCLLNNGTAKNPTDAARQVLFKKKRITGISIHKSTFESGGTKDSKIRRLRVKFQQQKPELESKNLVGRGMGYINAEDIYSPAALKFMHESDRAFVGRDSARDLMDNTKNSELKHFWQATYLHAGKKALNLLNRAESITAAERNLAKRDV
jgi:hypothetical protein